MIDGNINLGTFNVDKLIRDSERLAIVKEYVKEAEYIHRETLVALLGIKATEEESNAD